MAAKKKLSSKKKAPSRKKASKKKAPWDRPAPKKSKHSHLSPRKKAAAKASAKRAGRHYPNLVDNMLAAKGK